MTYEELWTGCERCRDEYPKVLHLLAFGTPKGSVRVCNKCLYELAEKQLKEERKINE